jgi:hypothetical protein
MKKLLLGISIALIALSCQSRTQNSESTPSNKHDCISKYAKERVSLNGLSYADADSMVTRFKKKPESSDSRTAIWFSKEWVDSVAAILQAEGADGFRIYFGKRLDGRNAVVVLSTIDDGPDPSAKETGRDHLDYFGHTSPFLVSTAARDTDEYSGALGATLYTKPDSSNECAFLGGGNYIRVTPATIAVKNFGIQKINTDNEWFPIGFIKYYRDELDNEPALFSADGIRIYFAFHTVETNPKHAGRHAFIIVTTRTINDPKTNKLVYRNDYYTCDASKKHGGDNGEQCPNNCNGVTLPN